MRSEFQYGFPLKDVSKAVSDPRVHFGQIEHAVDFAVPYGTEVFAAQNGEVVALQTESEEGGFEQKYIDEFWKYTNLITIKHSDIEYSQYVHLAKASEVVKIGDKVVKGQMLATTGLSGYMSAPHLHFVVCHIPKDREWYSVPIQWDESLEVYRP